MDIRMPRLDCLQATRAIACEQTLAGTRILIFTTFDRDEYVFKAIRSGAGGFLVQDPRQAHDVQARCPRPRPALSSTPTNPRSSAPAGQPDTAPTALPCSHRGSGQHLKRCLGA